MEQQQSGVRVCVTGGAGYLASFLINHLLERGYFVHATLRSLGDASKVGLLKSLSYADTRLKLFEADIYKPNDFAAAIEGCEFVVHMATPLQHYPDSSLYKNISEAAVAGLEIIMETCLRSTTVRKLIYTASVVSASPLKEDGSGYREVMDETCWTPLNRAYSVINDYTLSKTLSEKQVLSYDGRGIRVVSLACGLVGGDTLQSRLAESMETLISQATADHEIFIKFLSILEEMLGKVPIVHVKDVTDAHIFSIENLHVHGRFLCASDFLSSAEIAALIQKCGQSISNPHRFLRDTESEVKWGSRKMEDVGFQYKCDAQKIISDTLICAKRLGRIHET